MATPINPGAATEVIAVASGKGGTGKTIILTSLGYALQTSGHRVLFVDCDTATDGLSLFVLGPRGWEQTSSIEVANTISGYLRGSVKTPHELRISPFKVNRGRQDDHGLIYDIIISNRGLYGDIEEEFTASPEPQLSHTKFTDAIKSLFDDLRSLKQWDYILVDTRGGFGYTTTDICALSDSFFLVTEPDFTSFHQDKSLAFRIARAASDLQRKPALRGVIVNKATLPPEMQDENSAVHTVDLERVEANFRTVLSGEFGLRYSDTHPVPLDIEAVQAYKSQRVPYVACPGSLFSYTTLTAFSSLMQTTVVARWSEESTSRWNALVDRIDNALREEDNRRLEGARQKEALGSEIERVKIENASLREQLEELKASITQTGQNEKLRLERDKILFEREERGHRWQLLYRLIYMGIAAAASITLGWLIFQGFMEYRKSALETNMLIKQFLADRPPLK